MRLTTPFNIEPSHQSNHLEQPYNQYNPDGYTAREGTEERVRIDGSPLFGVNELEDGVGSRLPHEDDQVKGYPAGVGELSLFISSPCSNIFKEEDIPVDPLPTLLPFDCPLPLITPSLSPEVLYVEKSTRTDPKMYDVDFELFNFGQIQPQELHFYPPPAPFPPRPSTSYAPASHGTSSFSHLQARAIAFDHSLQSPLGESPLIPPSHSMSPQFSDGTWSPEGPTTGDFDYSGSPLLMDNLGLNQSGGDGLAGICDPASMAHPRYRSTSNSGLVSSYHAASSSPQLPPQLDMGRDSNPTRFSPIMSQRTYDDLFTEVTTSVVAIDSLPPLPPTSSHKSLPEAANLESPIEEEDNDENEQDFEWIPRQCSPAPTSTRSTRRRTSFSTSLSPAPPPSSSKTRKTTAPPILPLDAPIQTRNYQVSSRTSRKPIPAALQRANEKAIKRQGEGFTQEYLESEADRRRRLNTLSARESRKRKSEAIEQQARENIELKDENEWLRERVDVLEKENECLRGRIADRGDGGKKNGNGKRARRE